MQHRISLFPQAGDENLLDGYLGGTQHDIPVLTLTSHVEIAFHNLDAAVIFLDTLSEQATSLATAIRVHQRQQNLLAAVEETPHDPQQAEQIRAAYEGAQ